MMASPLRLGISPCPNDTYIFGALALGLIPSAPPLAVDLQDVENCVKLFVEFARSIAKDESFNW